MHPICRPHALRLCLAALILAVLVVAVGASPSIAASTETEVLTLVNQQRAAHGLAPFAWQDNLATAAREHSQDMAAHNVCSHTGSDGADPGQRISRAGYSATSWGETVACGQRSPAEVVDAWMNSSGHRAILLGSYAQAGVGHVTGSNMGNYWTVDVATGKDAAPPAPAPASQPPARTNPRAANPTPRPAKPSTHVLAGPGTDQEAQALFRILSRKYKGRESIVSPSSPAAGWTQSVQIAPAALDRKTLQGFIQLLRFDVEKPEKLPGAVARSGRYSVDIYTPAAWGPDGWSVALGRRYQNGMPDGRVKLHPYSGGQYVHVTGLDFTEASRLRTLARWLGFTAYVRNFP